MLKYSALVSVDVVDTVIKIIVGAVDKFVRYLLDISSKNNKSRFAMSTSCEWKGVSISQIIGSDTPWGAPEFPLVQPAHNHTVLYHIPASGAQLDRPPKPQIGKDKWDQDHVRMPFSSHSLYPVENVSNPFF